MLKITNQFLIVTFYLLLSFSSVSHALYQYTPSDVYTETLKIEQEVEIIRQYFNAPIAKIPVRLDVQLKPRNAWQKTYEIFVKINILRQKNKLPRIEETGLAPVKSLDPGLVHEQVRRILAELDIFKTREGISKQIKSVPQQQGKTPSDVYHLLDTISSQLDSINGESFTPSFVFAQNMRILEDLNTIIAKLNIHDRIEPPNRVDNASPSDVFDLALEVMIEIQRLQAMAGIESVEFSALKKQTISPGDVFTMTGMIISGLQPIKAYLTLNQQVTPPAIIYKDKRPADALQTLGWALRKIKLIRNLDY